MIQEATPLQSVTFQEAANRTCTAWATLTHRLLSERSVWSSKGHQWDAQRFLEMLNEARELDPSGLTAIMMARGAVHELLNETHFTGYTLLTRRDDVEAGLNEINNIWKEMDHPDVLQAVADFRQVIERGLDHYQVKDKKRLLQIRAILEDPISFALMRRDALKAGKEMRVDQFSWGTPAADALKVNTTLLEVRDINEALVAIRRQEVAAMSLIAFPQPNKYQNQEWRFGFVIRNGESVTVVWDPDSEGHNSYNRGADRSWHNNAGYRNWFPDPLVNWAKLRDEDDAESYVSLAKVNPLATTLGELNTAPPQSILWLIMVQDILNFRFGKHNERVEKPSFTTRMVRTPELMSGGTLALPAPQLEAKPITLRRVGPTAGGRKPLPDHVAWMEKKYGPLVPQAMLDLIGKNELLQLAASIAPPSKEGQEDDEKDPMEGIKVVPENAIGTAEEIEQLRLDIARQNKYHVVQKLAKQDFDDTRIEVENWLHGAVKKNAKKLIDAAVTGEFVTHMPPNNWQSSFDKTPNKPGPRNILQVAWGEEFGQVLKPSPKRNYQWNAADKKGPDATKTPHVHGGYGPATNRWEDHGPRVRCAIYPEEYAVFHAAFRPGSPESLAAVLGIDVEALPWQLRHWYSDRHAPRDREDLTNPWIQASNGGLQITVGVSLCLKAYNELRAKKGLPGEKPTRHLPVYWDQVRFHLGHINMAVCAPTGSKAFNRMHNIQGKGRRSKGSELIDQTKPENLPIIEMAQARKEVPVWQHPETGVWDYADDWGFMQAEVDRVFNERKVREHQEKVAEDAKRQAERDAEEIARLQAELGDAEFEEEAEDEL